MPRLSLPRLPSLRSFRFQSDDFRQATRATAAALVSYGLAWWLDLPKGYWAVLTAVLVVQSSLGASLAVARDRSLGTLAGGVVGVGLAMLAGPSFSSTVLLFALGIFATAALASRNGGFKLAPVTVCVVMLADPSHHEPWMSGLERVIEIAIGGGVGLACALLILPARASGYLFPHVADTLDACAELIEKAVGGFLSGSLDPSQVDALNATVRTALRGADTRAAEARREEMRWLGTGGDLRPIVRGGRRLWHSVIMLLRGADQALPPQLAETIGPALASVARNLSAYARAVAICLRSGEPTEGCERDRLAAGAAVQALGAEMERLARDGAFSADGASLVRLAAAVAACEHIRENLADLASRFAEMRTGPKDEVED